MIERRRWGIWRVLTTGDFFSNLLGPAAIQRLLDLYRKIAAQAAQAQRSEAEGHAQKLGQRSQEAKDLQKQRDALAETIIASVDGAMMPLSELVDVLLVIFHGDVHKVYGEVGPLGTDFMEPGDLDWHSTQVNEALIKEAIKRIEIGVSHHPADWGELRRLLRHPSENLRLRAFELCADRADPYQLAELALEALEGHICENDTQWTGQVAALRLAAAQGGAGMVHVTPPHTKRTLIAAIRARITPAHRGFVQTLAKHPLPELRFLAAQWAGELGDAQWTTFLFALLQDTDPQVIQVAVGAILALSPEVLNRWVRSSDASQWSEAHERALLLRLRPPRDSYPSWARKVQDDERTLEELISEEALCIILARAADRALIARGEDKAPADDAFKGYPSLVEQVIEGWPQPLSGTAVALFRGWAQHEADRIRAVGFRLLAGCGISEASLIKRGLQDEAPLVRFSAAISAVRGGVGEVQEEALAVLRGVFSSPPDEADLRAVGVDPSHEKRVGRWIFRQDAFGSGADRRKMLLWALRSTTPLYVAAITLVAHGLPIDHSDSSLTIEGEEIVREVSTLIQRWGPEATVILELLDSEKVDIEYAFLREMEVAARAHPSLRAAICERAERGLAASSKIFEALVREEKKYDLEGLTQQLRAQIFPSDWEDMRRLWRAPTVESS